jgi:hypothetical protein
MEFIMSFSPRKILCASALLAVAALVHPARADVLFQTATPNPAAPAANNSLVIQGDGTTAGDGFSGGSFFIGADFSVTATTRVTSIGADFTNTAQESTSGPNGDGSIFGAIVQVDPVTGLPLQGVENLSSITLAEAVFTPTQDGDTTVTLPVVLPPGTYGIVFGSGLFNATGTADLLAGNDTVGSPSVFENDFAPFTQDPQDTDVRLFVNAVPEPGSLAMLLSAGLMFVGLVRRRA